ncbi:MAG: Sec-independent protein translocase subunit TatA [Chromatiales bacterium]
MGIGVSELLIVLAIVALLFGTKKLRNIGTDLGAAIKSFRKATAEGEEAANASPSGSDPDAGPAEKPNDRT